MRSLIVIKMKHNNTIATPDLSGTPARCKPSLHEALATPELSGVKFPAVPRLSTRLHISHTKWSDLARLGSQKAPATAKRRNVSSRSVLGYIMGHAHILDALMLNCPDFSTLFALVTSCQTAKRAFEHHPAGIIKAMLQTMPQELQYLTTALIGINGCPIGHSRFIRRHMEIWLGMGPKPLTDRLQVCSWEPETDTQTPALQAEPQSSPYTEFFRPTVRLPQSGVET